MKRLGVFVGMALVMGGCSTSLKKAAQPVAIEKPVRLTLKQNKGRVEKSKYYSHSKVEAYEQGHLVRERKEVVDFTIENRYKPGESGDDLVRVLSTTVEKDGLVDLHDLAFPQLDETIEFFYRPNGRVHKAGGFSKDSVFYVPPIPLPEKPVQVGATWTMKKKWVSRNNNIPLKVDMVGILKDVYSCQDGQSRCADIEISGDVKPHSVEKKAEGRFSSEIKGRLFFNIDKGSLVWSEVLSQEELQLKNSRIEVESCITSKLVKPKNEKWPLVKDLKCDLTTFDVPEVPGT